MINIREEIQDKYYIPATKEQVDTIFYKVSSKNGGNNIYIATVIANLMYRRGLVIISSSRQLTKELDVSSTTLHYTILPTIKELGGIVETKEGNYGITIIDLRPIFETKEK
jgi:hypothetical protein